VSRDSLHPFVLKEPSAVYWNNLAGFALIRLAFLPPHIPVCRRRITTDEAARWHGRLAAVRDRLKSFRTRRIRSLTWIPS